MKTKDIVLNYKCDECSHSFELKYVDAFDKIVRCPKCGEMIKDERLDEFLRVNYHP